MLKRFFGGNGGASAAPALPDSSAPTIDIKHAIDAHMQWRHRLESYARGQSLEQFEITSVVADHHCELGQWIHSVGRERYGHLPQFQELDTVHADFHRQAGVIVDATHRNQRDKALELLGSTTYSRTATKLKHLLAKVYVEVLCVENPVRGHAVNA